MAYPGYDEGLRPVCDPTAVAAVKERYGIEGDYFLYLGTLQPRKNLVRLIAAFAHAGLGTPILVLAGRPGWRGDEPAALAYRLGLQERVLFPHYVPQEDKAALLSGALAFVFPSLHEGFGLPVLEAQACGCPVICSNTSSLPEVAGEGALLVDPTDTAALAAALAHIAQDAALREELTERGYANLRRFSWQQCARTVLGVCAQILGQEEIWLQRASL